MKDNGHVCYRYNNETSYCSLLRTTTIANVMTLRFIAVGVLKMIYCAMKRKLYKLTDVLTQYIILLYSCEIPAPKADLKTSVYQEGSKEEQQQQQNNMQIHTIVFRSSFWQRCWGFSPLKFAEDCNFNP